MISIEDLISYVNNPILNFKSDDPEKKMTGMIEYGKFITNNSKAKGIPIYVPKCEVCGKIFKSERSIDKHVGEHIQVYDRINEILKEKK